ncbi:P-loop ATPase, Sll1717 family [Phormidesmis sp. 146-33]
MNARVDLGKLTFGNDDAERDAKQGFLSKVFLKTALYNRIKADQSELVIGRKGAGKSATCLILKNAFESEGMKVALLTPESLSQQKIQALKINSINKEELYLQAWKYVLLVKVTFEFIDLFDKLKVPNLHKLNDDLKAARDFLKKQGEVENDFGSNLSGLFKIFSKVSVSFAGFEGAIESNKVESEIDLMDSLTRFEVRLKKLLRHLNSIKIVILIDKVDEVWNDTEESKLMISGLLRATHILNETLPMTKIMVFLRSDIFDVLKFHDIDKLNSLAERLAWSEGDLKQLIENRVKISTNFDSPEKIDNTWEKVFDRSVRSQDSFKYILSRTLRRPRETIQFCNRALRIAQDHQHSKITEDDILTAEIQYSAEKLRDLASEYLVQYPYLDVLFGLFQGFKLSFDKNEFDSRYQEAKDRIERLHPTLQSLNIDGLLQILYNIGFLGAIVDSAYVFFYNLPNLTLPQQKMYIVHPAFHSALGIQERIVALNDFQNVSISGVSFGENLGGIVIGNVSQSIAGGDVYVHNIFGNSELKRTLAEAAKEIQQLLQQLEVTDPTATEIEKVSYVSDETTPSFKRRLVSALRAGNEVVFEESLDHPYISIGMAVAKSWIQAE